MEKVVIPYSWYGHDELEFGVPNIPPFSGIQLSYPADDPYVKIHWGVEEVAGQCGMMLLVEPTMSYAGRASNRALTVFLHGFLRHLFDYSAIPETWLMTDYQHRTDVVCPSNIYRHIYKHIDKKAVSKGKAYRNPNTGRMVYTMNIEPRLNVPPTYTFTLAGNTYECSYRAR